MCEAFLSVSGRVPIDASCLKTSQIWLQTKSTVFHSRNQPEFWWVCVCDEVKHGSVLDPTGRWLSTELPTEV